MSAHMKLLRKGIPVIPFFILTISLLSANALAQSSFTPELKIAMVKISEMRFAEAEKLVERSRLEDPANRVPDYIDAAILCISLFLNEDQAALKQQQGFLDKTIKRIEALPKSDPYRNLFLGEIYVAQAILNGKFRNNLTAAWQFYKAYQYLTDNHQKHPQFAQNHIPLGVLYCAIGSLPEDYRRIASLLGFEGDVSEGMSLLETAFKSLSKDPALDFYTNYAGFVYSYVSFQLNPSLGISPRSLNMNLTSSSFLLYLQARISYEHGKVQEAAHWLNRRPKGSAYAEFYHLDYLQGKYLLALEPDKSAALLKYYIRQSPTDLYRKSAYRYLSWHYLLEGDAEAAEFARIKVLTEGSANTGADRQAQLEAAKKWNETLIKARVLFDAAEYQMASEVLENTPIERCCSTATDRAEYYYRQGRIYQEMHEYERAATAFTTALSVPNVPDNYAIGNSALQLALIAETTGELTTARSYFNKALKYDQYPFYEGIHQRAKAGLDRLE